VFPCFGQLLSNEFAQVASGLIAVYQSRVYAHFKFQLVWNTYTHDGNFLDTIDKAFRLVSGVFGSHLDVCLNIHSVV
jgi:hypothetical protein